MGKERLGRSKNEAKIPRSNPSNIHPMESIYPEYWPDHRGKNGHICCYYCGIQSHERSICKYLKKAFLEKGSDYRAFHPLRGELSSNKAKKKSEPKPSKMKLVLNQGQGRPESGHLKIPAHPEPEVMSVLGLQCGESSMSSLQSMKSIKPTPSNTHQIESNLSPLDTIKSKEVGKNEKTYWQMSKLERKIEK